MSDAAYYEQLASRIEYAFGSHRIHARVWDPITLTPGFAQFKFTVGANVRTAKVTGLHAELAYNLGVKTVRIYRRGGEFFLEIPRTDKKRGVKVVDQVRALPAIPVNTALLGLQPDGAPLLTSLGTSKIPHGLIAGASGSGKTVLLRTMLVTLALWNPPGRLQLALIDPKDRGLAPFAPLPHVWRGYGVISEADAAAQALEALVLEMERRDRAKRSLPFIVVAIDEFADLLAAGGKAISDPVTRITQRGREAGLAMLLATQRPDATMVRSLIKANLPLRLVGKVTSPEEAKIASGIAQSGGERLHGDGDFLLIATATDAPIRFQAAFAEGYELDGLITLASLRIDKEGRPHRHRNWSDLPYQLPDALPRPAPVPLPAGLGRGYVGASSGGSGGGGEVGSGAGERTAPRAAAREDAAAAAPTSHLPTPTAGASLRRGAGPRTAPRGEGSRLRDRYSVAQRLAALTQANGNRKLACELLYGYYDTITLRLMAEAVASAEALAAQEATAAAETPSPAEHTEESAE